MHLNLGTVSLSGNYKGRREPSSRFQIRTLIISRSMGEPLIPSHWSWEGYEAEVDEDLRCMREQAVRVVGMRERERFLSRHVILYCLEEETLPVSLRGRKDLHMRLAVSKTLRACVPGDRVCSTHKQMTVERFKETASTVAVSRSRVRNGSSQEAVLSSVLRRIVRVLSYRPVRLGRRRTSAQPQLPEKAAMSARIGLRPIGASAQCRAVWDRGT